MVQRRRLFTLPEAIELLPVVRRIIEEARTAMNELDTARAVLEAVLALASGNGHPRDDVEQARKATEQAGSALEARMAELDGLGVELKGVEEGLVDFPCVRDGRIVYLCWRFPEETISWWHEIDAGFAGRQPLEP
jgi:hypothetical protein